MEKSTHIDSMVENRKNISDREQEKIKRTESDLQNSAKMISNLFAYADFCQEKGVQIDGSSDALKSLDWYGALADIAGPEGILKKGLISLEQLIQRCQLDFASNIDTSLENELRKRMSDEGGEDSGPTKNNEMNNKDVSKITREKLSNVVLELERLSHSLRNVMLMAKYCDQKGIQVDNRIDFSNMRAPGEVAGPDSELAQGLLKLNNIIYSAQEAFARQIPQQYAGEFESRLKK